VPEGTIAILADQPYLGFGRVARLFHPPPGPRPGIHPTAGVDGDAMLGEGVEVGPYAVIGAAARIGAGCVIGAHVVVGPGVEIGEGSRLHPHCSVSHAILGREVVLHPGARIGQEGFGFAATPDGRFETMPQLGRVILGDAVEVGANACVDRGSQGDTVLGPGTRLDNLVQIGHNVRAGRGCILVAQVGISGSTALDDWVQVAAQAGLAGHLRVGAKARIGAQAGVMNDVPAGTDVVGSPAWPAREFWRALSRLRKLGGARVGAAARALTPDGGGKDGGGA
jgi:UDP-3-O-[3-hydroxymyristoyl] glucosamine N-acyltransferase